MNQEGRFLLAISLMILVIIGTNILFPPAPPEELGAPDAALVDSNEVATEDHGASTSENGEQPNGSSGAPTIPGGADAAPRDAFPADGEVAAPGRDVFVEGPLYRFTFSTRGANLTSAELTDFVSFAHGGVVELVPEGSSALGNRLEVGESVIDLTDQPFEVEPAMGLTLESGGGPETITFTYRHPTQPFEFAVAYTFDPDRYEVGVETRVRGIDRALLLTDLGTGIAYNETRIADESRVLAYVVNQTQEGIRAERLGRVDARRIESGPFLWVALKSKYFLMAMLPGDGTDEEAHLGGLIAEPVPAEDQAYVAVTQPFGNSGVARYRLFIGPQNFDMLSVFGNDLENVNPYGWKWMRPMVRPLAGIVLGILNFLHDRLNVGYGWVLIIFGVMMRVLLFPLNQKAMRAQMKNMAVQPLIQEIQTKHKDDPEKLQKEMMKVWKEHGFNPLGGCLPMLLPWPILITLFFVFQNTIELRGQPFLWLPNLSAADPLYILPIVLAISMFALQWIGLRSMDKPNPQMKMMMWMMPIMMMFIFLNLASGLNLYYATANLTTLPQQYFIAKERKKLQAAGPLKTSPS